jgi:hypothetical protein
LRWFTVKRAQAVLLLLVLIVGAGNLIATHDEVQSSSRQLRAVSVTVSQLHAAEVSFCGDSNKSRAQQVQLWTHLASIATPSPHLTRAQLAASMKKIAELLAYIRHDFRPRPCRAIYKIPG